MNEQILRGLVKKATIIYFNSGMAGLENWANSQNGKTDYSKGIYEIICEKNSKPSTSLFSIYPSLEEEIVERILKNGRK